MPDDQPAQADQPRDAVALLADSGIVDPRADGREQSRQQGEDDRHAHQRDQHAAEAHAAQEGHRHDDQRDQADRDRHAGGDDRVPGGLHRDDHGLLVVVAVRALLPPARDDEQRVVDRDTEADQRDQELHDEADVGERRQAEHEQERREDRDRGDDQRQQRQERGEDEEQDDQCTRRTEQGLGQHARPRGVTAGRQHAVGRQPAGEAGRRGRLVQSGRHLHVEARAEGRRQRRLDQRVRRPAVVGQESLVPRAREVDQPRAAGGRSPWCRRPSQSAAWLPWTVWPSGTVTVATNVSEELVP